MKKSEAKTQCETMKKTLTKRIEELERKVKTIEHHEDELLSSIDKLLESHDNHFHAINDICKHLKLSQTDSDVLA
jgi:chaperonin cofactor prefoldin